MFNYLYHLCVGLNIHVCIINSCLAIILKGLLRLQLYGHMSDYISYMIVTQTLGIEIIKENPFIFLLLPSISLVIALVVNI